MYPHNSEQLHTDTVQLEALDCDPDIDSNKDSPKSQRRATVSVNSILEDDQSIPELIDDSSTEPDTTTFHQDPTETEWPDAPTVQIPYVPSTTMDSPPEVTYHHRTTVHTADREEIPDIEEEEEDEWEHDISNNNLSHTTILIKKVNKSIESILANSKILMMTNIMMK